MGAVKAPKGLRLLDPVEVPLSTEVPEGLRPLSPIAAGGGGPRLGLESGVYREPTTIERQQAELRAAPAPARTAPIESMVPAEPSHFAKMLQVAKERSGLDVEAPLGAPIEEQILRGAVRPLQYFGAGWTLGEQALNLPADVLHGYEPGATGPGLGETATAALIATAPFKGKYGWKHQKIHAQMTQAAEALKTPRAKGAIQDLYAALDRGEQGMVAPYAVQELQAAGVPQGAVAELLEPILRNKVMLGNIGKAKVKPDVKAQQAIDKVLEHISVGGKALKKKYTASDFYRDWVDELSPLRKMMEANRGPSVKELQKDFAIAMKRGEESMVSRAFEEAIKLARDDEALLDPYTAFRLLPGSWGKVDTFLGWKPFNITTLKPIKGKALTEILAPISGDKNSLRAYMMARQALALERAGIKTGFDLKAARTTVRALSKTMKKPADELVEYSNNVLRTLLDSGIISASEYKKMVVFHKHYAPMHIVAKDADVVFSRSAWQAMKERMKGRMATKPLQPLRGSTMQKQDPLESIIRNTYLYVRAADRNLAMQSLLDYGKRHPDFGKLFRRVKAVTEAEVEIPDELMAQEMKVLGLNKETLKALSPSGFFPQTNTVAVWRDGVRELYEVPADIARVVKAMDKPEISTLLRLMSVPARLLRAGATLSPEFIARNPIRDQLSAAVYSKYGFVPGADFIRGLFHLVRRGDMYWQWKMAGGEHSMLVSLDRQALQADLNRVLAKHAVGGLTQETLRGWRVMNPLSALQVASMAMEKTTRLGEFAKAVKKMGTAKEALQKAAFASREVSLDFARAGTQGRAMNMITAFWNAQIQGLDKMGRAFRDQPFTTSFKIGAYITLPSVWLAMTNVQDGRWREIPSWQKNLFWVYMTGSVSKEQWDKMTPAEKADFSRKNPIIRIPKPFELGMIFGSGPERAVEWLYEKDPRAIEDYIIDLAKGASPAALPTVVLPFIEIAANQSFFTGSRLVPRGQEDILPVEQRRAQTTIVARKLSELVAAGVGPERTVSPIHIDQIIRDWSGGIGTYAMILAGGLLQAAGIEPFIEEPDQYRLKNWPLFRGFIVRHPTASSADFEKFYDSLKKSETYWNTANRRMKTEGDTKAKEYFMVVDARMRRWRGYQTAISNTLQVAELIRRNPEMDANTKGMLIDRYIFLAGMLAKKANSEPSMAELIKSGAKPPKMPVMAPPGLRLIEE